jgi:hypothetical protein
MSSLFAAGARSKMAKGDHKQAFLLRRRTSNKCTITGPNGLETSFPVKSCQLECMTGMVRVGSEDKPQIQRQFAEAFTTKLQGRRCICSVGDREKVQFNAAPEAMEEECANDSQEAHKECWEQYLRALSSEFEILNGETVVPKGRNRDYEDPKFEAGKASCTQTECDDKCRSASIPQITDILAGKPKLLKLLEKTLRDSNASPSLKDFASSFAHSDHAALSFARADEDDDGRLTPEEIASIWSDMEVMNCAMVKNIDFDDANTISAEEYKELYDTFAAVNAGDYSVLFPGKANFDKSGCVDDGYDCRAWRRESRRSCGGKHHDYHYYHYQCH